MKKFLNAIEFKVFKLPYVALTLLILLYITFQSRIESILNAILVDPVLNKVQYSLLHDIFFYALLLLLTLTFVNRFIRNYTVSLLKIASLTILCIWYIFYREFSNEWTFIKLRTLNVFYCDLITFYLMFQFLLLLRNILIKPAKLTERGMKYILDNPLSIHEPDRLQRWEDAVSITNTLKNTRSEKAVAIGITGSWGTGKSSFFQLMKRAIIENKNSIIIEFNPWRGYRNNALSQDFFESLSNEIGKHSDLLKSSIIRYSNTLLNVDNSFLKSAVNLTSDVFGLSSVEKQHQEINETLKKIDRDIFIFIDDLDRLSSEEIMDILKLVRNTADFYNLKFILSYDKGYLSNAIKAHNPFKYDTYLEKIVLHEHALKPIDEDQIIDQLFALLETHCVIYSKELREVFRNRAFQRRSLVSSYLLNLRDVKRYANVFIPDYNKHNAEVDLIDYANFGLLKMKYPIILLSLYYNKDLFFEVKDDLLIMSQNTTDTATIIEEYINDKENNLMIDYADRVSLLNLLEMMFGTVSPTPMKPSEKSIRKNKNFAVYFKSEIDKGYISAIAFDDLLTSPPLIIGQKIQRLIEQGKRVGLLDKFTNYDIYVKCVSRGEFERFIFSLFVFANIFNKDNSSFPYPEDDIFKKLKDSTKISTKYYLDIPSGYRLFLEQLFTLSIFPIDSASEFFGYLLYRKLAHQFILGQDKVEEYAIKYFDYYCSTSNKTDGTFRILYDNCVTGNITSYGTKVHLLKAIEIYKRFIFKNRIVHKSFLQDIINEKDANQYLISESVLEPFGTFLAFSQSLQTSPYSHEPFVVEFLELINKFIEVGNQPIEFILKELKKQKNT